MSMIDAISQYSKYIAAVVIVLVIMILDKEDLL